MKKLSYFGALLLFAAMTYSCSRIDKPVDPSVIIELDGQTYQTDLVATFQGQVGEEVTLGRHAGAMFRSYTDDADDVENMSVHGMFHPTFTVPGNDGPPGNAMSSLIRATSGSRGSSATDSSVFSAISGGASNLMSCSHSFILLRSFRDAFFSQTMIQRAAGFVNTRQEKSGIPGGAEVTTETAGRETERNH